MRIILVGIFLAISIPALAQDAPKKLTANDLEVETHKWDGKLIQTIAQCFFADVDEYRCLALRPNGMVGEARIDFRTIQPPEIKKFVEDNCDTVEKTFTRSCRFQINFTYSGIHTEEHSDGSRLAAITAKDSSGTFARLR